MDLYWLVLGALAVWRLTHLLQAEDGPADLLSSCGIGRNGLLGKGSGLLLLPEPVDRAALGLVLGGAYGDGACCGCAFGGAILVER